MRKKIKKGGVILCEGTSGEKMTDETPEFICRGCGYHKRSCVCSVQKQIPVVDKSNTNAHLMYFV